MNRPLYLIFLLLVSFVVHAGAADLFPLQNFSPSVYNGESQNWSISQNENNVLYFANNKGLLQYNGGCWRLYNSPNKTILRSVYVHNSRIYTGCFMEFGYWERDKCMNLCYKSLSRAIQTKLDADEQIWEILSCQNWILFQSLHHIYIYNLHTHHFQVVSSSTTLPKMFQLGDQICFQKLNQGVYIFDKGKTVLLSDFPVFKTSVVIKIFKVDDKILFLTQDHGFYFYQNGVVTPWNNASNELFKTWNIYSAIQTHDGGFALGTIGHGLFLLDTNGNIIQHVDKSNGLQNNTVLSMYEDKDNNLWLGLDNGVSVMNLNSPFRSYTDTNGQFGTVYASIVYQNTLYLGTNQGLFCRSANNTEPFRLVDGTSGQVWMLKVLDNTLFCGHNKGTFVVDRNRAQLICTEMGTWDIKKISGDSNLLLQGNYEGLFVLEKTGTTWHVRNKLNGFNISCRYFDLFNKDELFVNHEYKGVYRLHVSPDFRRVVSCHKVFSPKAGYNSSVVVFNAKLLYFSSSGIFEYQPQKQQFVKNRWLTEQVIDGDQYCSGKMINEGDKNLWLFTARSLVTISSGKMNQEPVVRRFAFPLEKRENVVGYENISKVAENHYLLGTNNGYVSFDFGINTEQKCSIRIESIEKFRLNQKAEYLPVTTGSCKLRSYENNLTVRFFVARYDIYSPVLYQYRVAGFTEQWTELKNTSELTISNLPPGDYRLELRAKTGNCFSENIATFEIEVIRPWYSSFFMWLVYMGLFVLLFWGLNRQSKKRYDRKIQEENHKQEFLKLKNDQMIALVQNEKLNSEIESVNRELAASTMAVMKKNELLSMLRNKLNLTSGGSDVKAALRIIDENLENNSDWESFQEAFNNTDRDFLKKIKELHPTLTPNDLKLCVYLRLNMASKEIAPMLNISPQSVEIKRFRLRKKMDLSHEVNLTDYILNI